MIRELTVSKQYIGRLNLDDDILNALTSICIENHIRLGRVEGLGAVRRAVIGFFNQESKSYETLEFNEAMEITSLIGNISLKDGEPFIHAHVTLAKADGSCIGGHLMEGTIAWACEFVIHQGDGKALERKYAPETTLTLW